MPGKSTTFENDYLKLVFGGVAIANIADNTATAPLTALFVALHTADPTDAGTQASNEAAYTGYARVSVARPAGWTVTGSSVSPAAAINFPACTTGTAVCTHFSVGVAGTGATKILYSGPITPPISVSAGVTPQLTNASTVTEG